MKAAPAFYLGIMRFFQNFEIAIAFLAILLSQSQRVLAEVSVSQEALVSGHELPSHEKIERQPLHHAHLVTDIESTDVEDN